MQRVVAVQRRPWTIAEERERAAFVLGVHPTSSAEDALRSYREQLARHDGVGERDRAARQALRAAWAVWRRTAPAPDRPAQDVVVAGGHDGTDTTHGSGTGAVEVLEITRDRSDRGALTVVVDDLAVVLTDDHGREGMRGRDVGSRPAEAGTLRSTARAWQAYTLVGDVDRSTTDVRL